MPVPPNAAERAELEAIRGGAEELDFADTIVRGVTEHKDAIDKLIGDSSTNWKVGRMAVVDRNILRMGTFELAHLPDIPPRVTLNEAIEIGKRYGTQDTGAFVNGILDKIATAVRGEARGGSGE
ncbi:MAG: transcription antitermination factor NusB [Deltaproteobacteria bacterium]|nr:transcription antitermination factor NusB [Deltaproteobacteria bacterium]